MFLSILVAAYWLRRCRNTWEGGKKKKQQLTPLNRPPGLNYVLASDRFSPSKGQIEKARFEALCAPATFGCPSKLHITMDTWYTRNPICTLDEKRKKKHNNCSAWCFKGDVKWLGTGAGGANGVWIEMDGKCSFFLPSPRMKVPRLLRRTSPRQTHLMLRGTLWEWQIKKVRSECMLKNVTSGRISPLLHSAWGRAFKEETTRTRQESLSLSVQCMK